jgi:uncharacterized protein (DUF736 family)
MKKSALIIGNFIKAENGVFTGKLETLAISKTITLQPNDDKEKDNQPDFIILHGQNEIGAAWEKNDQWGIYISLVFEEPSLAPGSYRLQKSGIEKGFTLLYRKPFVKKAA